MTEAVAASDRAISVDLSGARVARLIVIAAILFNLVLSFINASVMRIGASHVVAVELVLLGVATAMVASRSMTFYVVSAVVMPMLVLLLVLRYQFDAKAVRDAFIPIVFFFLGRHFGSPQAGDRVVLAAIVVVTAGALFEWLFLDTYLKYFDVLGYYQARGSVDASVGGDGPGLFISGLRFEGRTLLPFLGEHRVSSVFLEPVSLGNFGAIAFAWVLLRDHRHIGRLVAKVALIAMVLVLGDARFGLYLCGVVVLVFMVSPLIRPTMVFVLPFLIVIALVVYAGAMAGAPWDNTIMGRFLLSGQLLSTLDLGQAFGIQLSTVDFDDSGYSYVLSRYGIVGAAVLWGLYVYGSPAETAASWRFKLFVCVYLVLLLSISTSTVTIKTAGLLWFLAGCAAVGTAPAPSTLRFSDEGDAWRGAGPSAALSESATSPARAPALEG